MGKYSLKEIEKMTGQKSIQVSEKNGASERRKTNISADESRKLVDTYQKSERSTDGKSGTTGLRIKTASRKNVAESGPHIGMIVGGGSVPSSSSGQIPYLRDNNPLRTATSENGEAGRKKAADSAIAFLKNALYEFPGAKQFAKLVNKDNAEALSGEMSAVKEEHPVASVAGSVGGNMAAYAMGSQIMNAIPAVGNLTGQAANTVANAMTGGKLSQAAVQEGAKHIKNVLSDAALDLSMDTIPSLVKAASKGEDVGEVAAESTLRNLATNAGGEMFGMALGSLAKRAKGQIPELGRTSKNVEQVADSMGDASKVGASQADTITDISGEELRPMNQQLQNNLEEITSEAERLQGQADDILDIADGPKKITSTLKPALAKDSKFYTLDKEVSKLVRMYGNDSNLDDLDTFRKAIAEFETTGSSEAADAASMALDRIDKSLQGKTYKQADRLTKSGALKRKGQTYTYGQEYAGIRDLVDDAQQQFEDVFNAKGTFEGGSKTQEIPALKSVESVADSNQTLPHVMSQEEVKNNIITNAKQKIANFFDTAMKNKGQTGERYNQIKLGKVPDDVVEKVKQASGGTLDISGKEFGIEGGKLYHEVLNHSDEAVELSRGQLPITRDDIIKSVDVMMNPDIVENISTGLASEQRKTFAMVKLDDGYIVLVEAVGGKRNPTIVPEQILHIGREKMETSLQNGESIADMIYKNSPRAGTAEDNVLDIKNRVTAAINANDSASPYTSETPRRSPLSDSNIPFLRENVNGSGAKSSEDLWNELSGGADEDVAYLKRAKKRQDGYVTKTATNTLANSEVVRSNPEMQAILQDEIDSGKMTFHTVHEDESIKAAQDAFKKDAAAETDRLMSSNWKQAQDFDGGMMLLKSAADSGDHDAVRAVARKIAAEGHDAGVRLQALEKYSRTAEGTIAKAQNILNAEIKDWAENSPNDAKAAKELSDKIMEYVKNGLDSGSLAEGVSPVAGEDVLSSVKQIIRESKLSKRVTDQDAEEIAKLLTKGYSDQVESTVNAIMATQQYGISDDTIDKVIEIFDEANKYGENSKTRVDLENKAYALLANEVTTSNWQDKWNTWRYFSMLSKPATHIRNSVGNVGMNVVSGVKNDLAAVMESAVNVVNPNMQRTKSLLNPLSNADRGLISAASKDADDVAYRALSGSKYGATGGIKGQAKAFRSGPGKAIQKAADINSNLLEVEDWAGLKAKYSTSLAGYLKANKLGADVFNATDEASQRFLNLAREYAVQEAQRATFHEASALADGLSGVSKKLNESGTARGKAVSMLIEGIVPFKKTPINIVKTAGRYSPLGVADAVQKGIKAVSKGTYSASEVIDSLASGLTGTGIMALGAYLGSQGIVRGAGTGDEKQDSFDKMRGAQNYSIQVGDKSYTIDWAAPSVLPLLVGVELQQSMSDGSIDSSDIINAITSMADPVVETTMMSGLSNALSAAQYAEDDTERLTMAATNALTGYVSQGIPSTLGSVARAVDNTRRTAYPDDTGVTGQLERAVASTKNKIPFLSEQSPEYRDAWGRTSENSPFGDNLAANLLYQLASPGYYSEDKTTAVDNYVQGLYNRTGNDEVLPQNISRSYNIGGSRFKLSGEEYSRAQRLAGDMSYDLANYLRTNQGDISKSAQADMIDDLYGLSQAVAYNKVGGKPLSDSYAKLYGIYQDEGQDMLIQYLAMKGAADADGNGSTSQDEAQNYLDSASLSNLQKAYLWRMTNKSWKKNPYE